MTKRSDAESDWSLTTWKGSRRKQHEEFHGLPFCRKLELVEEMNEAALVTMERRRKNGLPYIDPYTGERVCAAKVAEDPPAPRT